MHLHLETISSILILPLGLVTLLVTFSITPELKMFYFNQFGGVVEFLTEEMTYLVSSQTFGLGWIALIAGLFVWIFSANWGGALLPIELITIPSSYLRAPTSDINITSGLALVVSHAYFFAGLSAWKIRYFGRYVMPVAYLLPINLLEDFSKPLSLSFRLLGNILADELTIEVLATLIPILVPIPVMLLGIFTSAIQALVFSTLAGAYIGESIEIFA